MYSEWMSHLATAQTITFVHYVKDTMLVKPDEQEVDIGSFGETHVLLRGGDKSSKDLGTYHIRYENVTSQH